LIVARKYILAGITIVIIIIAITGVWIITRPPPPPPPKAWELIDWEKPVPQVERIMGKGPVEPIPPEFIELGKEWYGVDLSGKKGILTGYILPEGWEEATKGVDELVLTNSGSLKHDPAAVLNALIFYKLTGIRLTIIEMKDPLLWPKTLSVLTAKATDVDVFYSTRSMLETPHLSAAGWLHPVDELWPPEVQELYPIELLESIKGFQRHGRNSLWQAKMLMSGLKRN
jgi:hypothetical protein